MVPVFDIASAILLACFGAAVLAVPPGGSRRWAWVALAAAALVIAAGRLAAGPAMGLDLAAALLLIAIALTAGRELVLHRTWPQRSFVVALAVVTATGAYWRAHQLADVLVASDHPLQADAVYYQHQALETANPFAAGQKSPLWPALNAPLVRLMQDKDAAMRLLSWAFGILMLPAAAWGIGRLFEPVVGVIVAGTLAVDSYLWDLCTQGLREELGVCLWMILLVLLFARGGFSWPRTLAAGIIGGVLLLLRNTDIPVLLALTAYALIRTYTPLPRLSAGLLLPVAIAAPFYVNQYRAYGDPFCLEKRDTRYHANFEFMGRPVPPGLSMPAPEEFKKDLYAGQPLSPAAYLLKFHTPRQFIANQWAGLTHVVLGEPFSAEVSGWLRLACAAGLTATLLRTRERFAAFFVAGSVLGIRAHLIATGSFEERLLLPVMVIWLAAGWWLLACAIRAGLPRWLLITRHPEPRPAELPHLPQSHRAS
jgi:hypothetical protein